MQRRRFISGVLCGAAGAMLSSCAQPHPLRIATNLWIGYESLYVARSRGSLPSNVQLVELLSATQVLAALRTGLVDVATLTLDEVVILLAHGVPLKVIGVFDTSSGADALVARSFDRLAGLRGARVGVEDGALGAYFLQRTLDHAGLTLADITVVSLDVSTHEAAFRDGRIDAVVTFEPVRARLLELGGTDVFNSRALPDEIVDVLVAYHHVLLDDAHHATLVSLLGAIEGVVRELDHNGAAFAEMGRRLSLTPAQVERSFEGIRLTRLDDTRRMLGGSPPPLASQVERLATYLRATGQLPPGPPLADFIDDVPARQAHG